MTNLKPREKREWVGSKHCVTSLSRLLTSLTGLFNLACCFVVRLYIANLCGGWFLLCPVSNKELMACEGCMEAYWRWCHPLSFHKWRRRGMRPAMASIPSEGVVRNTPVIHRAAQCCIFPSSYMFLAVGAPLKNQS